VVADRAETKGNTAALTQLSKDLASIRPYKVMLDTNANIAKELAQKIIKTDSQLANRPINWLQTHLTDSPDVGEFIAQLHFVTTEAARVLNNPRLVGQLTDNARKDMQDVINENMPLKTTIRILERMQKDGDNRVNAMTKEAAYLKKKIGGSAAMPTAAGENPAAVGGWSVVK
jgi:predicted phage-related endonuclease